MRQDRFEAHLVPMVLIIMGVFFLVGVNCAEKTGPRIAGDKIREFANELYNRELYSQAVKEYQNYLANYDVDSKEQANITYIIGNIYFDRLKDYENALAYYLKLKHFYPESNLIDEVNKRIVACLERLERSADAQQALEESASLQSRRAKLKRPGAVVAKIGKQEITQGDLDFEINRLPSYLKPKFNTKEKKLEFLKQYLATELLYDTAKRKGLDKDKEVIEGAFQAKKNLMVQKMLQEEIGQKAKVDKSDVELYYKANKDKYAEKDKQGNVKRQKSLDEVREQVTKDLINEKQQQAYDQLIQRLMRAENVEIYEDRIQ